MSNQIERASLLLREMIDSAISSLRAEGKAPNTDLPEYVIEIPADKSHGDFAANTAMVLDGSLKQRWRSPMT